MAVMWLWIRRVVVYLLLLVTRHRAHDRFVESVKRDCRKRRNRQHVAGITEELDEVTQLPDNCRDSMSFTGFSQHGEVVSFRLTRTNNKEESLFMTILMSGLGKVRYSQTRSMSFGRAKLNFEMQEPMTRWKVSFCGPVEQLESETRTETKHASVSLYWQCIADPFDHRTCVNKYQLAKNIAKQPLERIWKRHSSDGTIYYEQWGELRGTIRIDGSDDRFVRLHGYRDRKIEHISQITQSTELSSHIIQEGRELYLTTGCMFERSQDELETFGYVTYPLGERWATEQSGLKTASRKDQGSSEISYPFETRARGISYNVNKISTRQVLIETHLSGIDTIMTFSMFLINGERAYGVEMEKLSYPDKNQVSIVTSNSCVSDFPPLQTLLTTQLSSENCMNVQLTGGKGTNLAVLKSKTVDNNYSVPDGFCITTAALEKHIKANKQLAKAAHKIISTVVGKSISELPHACSDAVLLYNETEISQSFIGEITDELESTFGPDYCSKSFAIRSSGVSEDGTEASFAGQMDTMLGVKGIDSIVKSIRQCWASSLAYRAVEYRRQNGQPVIEAMAVVIQEMVDADVAGVLFTNDPVTGDSCSMMLNAAQGLGEVVVSGNTNPDTVWVSRGTDNADFQITRKRPGRKQRRMSVSGEVNGLDFIPNDESPNGICLSDNLIYALCSIGAGLEEACGCPQDIEWAVSRGNIYLLQSRPITSSVNETEEDLIHEFDMPMPMDSTCQIIGNVSEMLPGAVTPLTLDTIVRALDYSLARMHSDASGSQFPKYAGKTVGTSCNRPFVTETALTVFTLSDSSTTKNDLEIFFLGQALEEHTMTTVETYKGRQNSVLETLKCKFLHKLIRPRQMIKRFDEWSKRVDSFTIEDTRSSALAQYQAIDDKLFIIQDVYYWYAYRFVAIEFAMVIGMLRGESSVVSTKNSADIAILLANCKNVCSAAVPSSLVELAHAIAESRIKDEFMSIPDPSCHSLLMTCGKPIRSKYEDFMSKHGHRCIKEAEMLEKPWRADPTKVIRVLKSLIKWGDTLPKQHKKMTNAQVVDLIQTPLSRFQKFLIQHVMLDKVKAGVAARELGKSVCIKTVDAFKTAYWRLADLMVREGRLPEEELLFFLTHREIGTLLETRSINLVKKAKMRRRIYPKQEAIRLPKISFGPIVPLCEKPGDTATRSTGPTVRVTGLPVGQGVASGRACVLDNLADACNIQKGDILICPVTDVGWSPYFPMISGLVTEIGGLISHGAVVAREVGLPCIVNAEGATRLFRTGDTVRIDGLKGVLERCAESIRK